MNQSVQKCTNPKSDVVVAKNATVEKNSSSEFPTRCRIGYKIVTNWSGLSEDAYPLRSGENVKKRPQNGWIM